MPSLILSRATEADIDAMLDPLYAALKDIDIRKASFGYDTPATRAKTKQRIAASIQKGGQNIWLKVVEEETGRLISASWWMIVPADNPTKNVSIDYLEGEEQEMGEAMLGNVLEHRVRHTHNLPHILLELLFTDPSLQRSGAGTMQIQWGNALADLLFMPWYVEATPAGHHLYASNGAKDLEKVRFEAKSPSNPTGKVWISEYTIMRREPLRTGLKQKANNEFRQ